MSFFVNNTPDIAAETDRMSKKLDAKYQPVDLGKVAVKNKNQRLNSKINYMNC